MGASTRTVPLAGFTLAVGSAASFALSGVFASALIAAGWSAGAAAAARIVCAAIVLAPPTAVLMRGRWPLLRRAWRAVVLFGVLAVAGCQLAYFLAIAYIPPSIALLIEFMGPVLLMLWLWGRTRIPPGAVTLAGAALAVAGLATVSLGGGEGADALHPLGVAFALVAAIGNAAYYAAGATSDHGIAPLPFVGLGLAVAAILLAIACASGALPFAVSAAPVRIAGAELPAVVAVAGMVLVSTVIA
ncbi:EamA family transporter [Leucobacter allii]|uniref:EamA family transporter n=1 Tax=Leucobacter allii TaxID=2932247 RepID=UPI001FD3D4AF|nr:EamA family transporter [Leucobacter allii]UOR03019.1 EamA family transporter [Leucobacter allii]